MRIAVYGRGVEPKDRETLRDFFQVLRDFSCEVFVEVNYLDQLSGLIDITDIPYFQTPEELNTAKVLCLISMGGDGTLLDTLRFVRATGLPVLGINLGRLGFLSSVPRDRAYDAIKCLAEGHYIIEKRSMLEIHSGNNLFASMPFALNDFTIHKRDTGSMITIDTFLNGEFFNTYWADGIILSTPTGSTAYSLSCGGPVIFPDSNNFAITPSAPHNLNIRPIIVPDTSVVSFQVKGRGLNHLVSLDSRYEIIEYEQAIAIQKASWHFKLIRLNFQNFIQALRDKLSWGLDNRNF